MRKSILALATLLAFAAGCTVSKPPAKKPPPMNGGNTDAGAPLDSGVIPDAGPSTETTVCGPITPGTMDVCCPVDGKGCATQTCFFTTGSINAPQCRDLAMVTVGAEEECDANLNNCGSGYTCVQIGDMGGARCLKVCRANTNVDCTSEQDPMGNAYSCLFTFQENPSWGLCTPTPTDCVPYNDTCDAGEYCEVIGNDGQKGCVPEGMGNVGDACTGAGSCKRGGICINLGDGGKCEEPCDPANPMSCSDPMAKCGGELGNASGGLGFGICGKSNCSPITTDADCMMGENCELSGSALSCKPEGTATAGQTCGGASGNCARGNICINLQGAMGPVCYETCDAAMPACSAGACRGLEGFDMTWGICN